MKKAELKKMSAADLPEIILGTDHFNIPNLFRSIEEIHPDSPLISKIIEKLKAFQLQHKLNSEQEDKLNQEIEKREEYFKKEYLKEKQKRLAQKN